MTMLRSGGVEAVSVTLHGVFRREGGDGAFWVLVDNSGLDFMAIHLPALRVTALISLWIGACLIVNPIRLQEMLGHGLQSSWTVDFERRAPAGGPSGQDEIRITGRVIGVEVGHERYLQIGGLPRGDGPVENRRLVAANDTWSEIAQR